MDTTFFQLAVVGFMTIAVIEMVLIHLNLEAIAKALKAKEEPTKGQPSCFMTTYCPRVVNGKVQHWIYDSDGKLIEDGS